MKTPETNLPVQNSEMEAVFAKAREMCELFDIPGPLLSFGFSKLNSLIWFQGAMSKIEELNKPSIAIMSWSAFSCEADNLTRLVGFGLRSVTHILGFMGGDLCIVHLDPSWGEDPTLFFFNPSRAHPTEESKIKNQLNQF